VASAQAFHPSSISLRMSNVEQINRKQVLQSACAIASLVTLPAVAGAAPPSINKGTGFPEGSCLEKGNPLDPDNACTPMTNGASILDKQKAVLAGKITVGANKTPILLAALEGMKLDKKGKPLKKEKIELDKDYVLRFSALYFTPLKNSMEAYCERDANGARAAGGAGFPRAKSPTLKTRQDIAVASASPLYKYVTTVDEAILKINVAAKKKDFDGITKAAKEMQDAAEGLLKIAKPPILFN